MNRTRKKEISLNKDSVLSLMQEIYNELVEQRATAMRIQNKMLAKSDWKNANQKQFKKLELVKKTINKKD